jgi:hypothetical protein
MCKCLDANLIWAAHEVPGYRQACLPVTWRFWPKCILSEVIKKYVKEDVRDESSLTDLRPTRRVVWCARLAWTTLSENKVHTPFLKSWA